MVATSCFKYMGYNTFFHFTIDVLNLKLCFATDVVNSNSKTLFSKDYSLGSFRHV